MNLDYEGTDLVPADPIKTEDQFIETKCECGKTVKVKTGIVSVYDVFSKRRIK